MTINASIKAVSTPSNSINRLAATESYNPGNMASYFKTVDIMASFPNTMILLAANQLINNDAKMLAAVVLKSVMRDLKRYMKLQNKANGQRALPIGYNAATSSARGQDVLDYLAAGYDEITIEFWTMSAFSGSRKRQALICAIVHGLWIGGDTEQECTRL